MYVMIIQHQKHCIWLYLCGQLVMACSCYQGGIVVCRRNSLLLLEHFYSGISLLSSGSAWLIEGDGKGHSPEIDCSTSKFPGIEPVSCPTGYFCLIKEEEDPLKQMPNRGVCARRQTTKGNH